MTKLHNALSMLIAGSVLFVACERRGDDRAAAAGDTARAGAAPAEAITVTLTEWRVGLPVDTISAGQRTFRAVNSGTVVHRLEVEGNGREWQTSDIRPGAEATLTADLRPGTYEVYCPVETDGPDHDERGMRTVLVVI